MNYVEAFLLGVGLSMDALAVSIALGSAERKNFTLPRILVTAFYFGAFQMAMPLIGFFGGSLCGSFVRAFGKYVAAALLAFIGGKMIHDRNQEEKAAFGYWTLFLLAVATSIDALLVGVGFACLGRTGVAADTAIIGCTTFSISFLGGLAGRKFGDFCGSRCEILGGVVLILIGLKVLIWG